MPVIKCKHCGQKSAARIKTKKYCSKRCSDAARSKLLKATRVSKLKPRVCEHCSKEYQPKTANQKFCCQDCHYIVEQRRLKEKRDAQRVPKCCPVCTGFFFMKTGIQRFCSATCRSVAEKQERRLKAQIIKKRRERDEADWTPPKPDRQFRRRECVTCGEVFRPGHSQQKTCSEVCRAEHRYQSNKRLAKTMKEERLLAREAMEALNERLERKKIMLDQITGETSYSAEIQAFLAKGGMVKKYDTVWSADVLNSMPEEIF